MEIPSSFTETIFDFMSTPQTVLMSLPVWGLDFLGKKKNTREVSRPKQMLYIFMVDLAQYSAADSKTQHQAFTGTSHQVSANE